MKHQTTFESHIGLWKAVGVAGDGSHVEGFGDTAGDAMADCDIIIDRINAYVDHREHLVETDREALSDEAGPLVAAIVARWITRSMHDTAKRVQFDPDWSIAALWRDEYRNVVELLNILHPQWESFVDWCAEQLEAEQKKVNCVGIGDGKAVCIHCGLVAEASVAADDESVPAADRIQAWNQVIIAGWKHERDHHDSIDPIPHRMIINPGPEGV